jgi:enhancing lycopene biosynthesis protein 2
MKKFAVVLSGSGVYDGAEIHEAVMTLYAILNNGAEYQIFAPDIEQYHVINHLTGKEMTETRNVLVESARIARGNIKPLYDFKPENFDALIFPGGFGVAKNLSTFAFKGHNCDINKEVVDVVKSMIIHGKPIGALCISPAIIAKILTGVTITIGSDPETIKSIEKMGSKHIKTNHGEVIYDKEFKVYSTPCYMLDANILDIAKGADNIVKAILNDL